MSTTPPSTPRPVILLLGLLLALLVAGPATLASAAPPPNMPQKLSELSAEQKSWRDSDGVIWCSQHPQFPGCDGNPDTGYRYPDDDTAFQAQINNGAKHTTIDLSPGTLADNTVGKAVDSAFGKAAESIGRFSGDLLVESMTWWIGTDSISLSYAGVMAGKAPVQKVVAFIMLAGILTSAMVMMVTRRTEPGAQVLLGGVKYIVISSMALIVLSGAIHAGDDFAHQMIDPDANQFGQRVQAMLGTATIGNPGGVLLLGIVAFLLGAIQWVMGFVRQAGIIVLYNMILFAAAGQLTTWGRQWFPRIAATCVALVLYKPMAAFIYSLGFGLIGQEQSLTTLVTGLMVVALAVIALPAMLKFFAFMGTHVSGGSGALGVAAGGLAGGALAAAALGGGGASAGAQSSSSGDGFANFMSATGPGGSGEHDPTPGNGGFPALGAGGGQARLEAGAAPKALGPGHSGPDLEGGSGPHPHDTTASVPPESPDAAGTPVTGSGTPGPGADLAGAGAGVADTGTAASAAGDAGMAAGAGGAAAVTGGAALVVQTGVSAAGSVAERADEIGAEMTGDDTGPDMP